MALDQSKCFLILTNLNWSRVMKIKTRAIPINLILNYSISYAIGLIKLNLNHNRVLVSDSDVSIPLHPNTINLYISSGHYYKQPYSENTIKRGSWYLGERV